MSKDIPETFLSHRVNALQARAAVEKRDYRIKFLQRTVREEESKLVEALQATPDQLAKLREQHAHRLQSA